MSESQIKANPTKSTLDAVEHEADLEAQRQKRKDSSIIIENPANDARKSGTDDGLIENEGLGYPMTELEDLKKPQKTGKASPTVVVR